MRYIAGTVFGGDEMNRISLASIAAVLLLGTAPLQAQNLVTNGTFNTDASGWTLGGSGCIPAAFNAGTGNPPGSVLLNECGESDSDPFASQTIGGLTPGATYTVSVDIRLENPGSNSGTGKSFGIFLDNEPGNPLFMTEFLDFAWHTVTTKFVATSTTHTIIFASELDARTPGGPGVATDVSYFIDNVSLTAPSGGAVAAVPATSDPALIVLGALLAACGALALRRRYGRRGR
jgi:hypothetical protein